ncbi:NAD(P)-binding protein [Zopfia rhizophila CBS 207.26]|uniref:NAD(P)-binding protein n=1 Tax=Zopfia rhizophila CBS 207.26 TaxID=1314779 RepID=A0A6A6EUB5_9PEZI|nr:NAD(P)-binding protein [Zopfia rhizophila CBS 207.26]
MFGVKPWSEVEKTAINLQNRASEELLIPIYGVWMEENGRIQSEWAAEAAGMMNECAWRILGWLCEPLHPAPADSPAKTAIITGPFSGFGREIAKAYAQGGAQIYCVDLYPNLRNAIDPVTGKADSLHNRITTGTPTHDALTQTYGGKHIFVRSDLTKTPEVEDAVATCAKGYGRLDVISTHVRPMRIHETEEADNDKTMAISAKCMFLGCKYTIWEMLKQEPLSCSNGDKGWIINTANIQDKVGYFGTPSYCASKGAAVMLTRQIALDYGRDRIHCNALYPGYALQTINDAHPFGGMGQPEDVARVAVFIRSDDARWWTGVPLPVDGGFVCQ